MREYAAFFDVGHENPASIGVADGIKVGDIAFHQIEFHRTSGAFGDDDIEVCAELIEGVVGDGAKGFDVLVVIAGGDVAFGFAEDDELGGAVSGGFEEHRIREGAGGQAAGLGLGGLCASDFGAAGSGGAVV